MRRSLKEQVILKSRYMKISSKERIGNIVKTILLIALIEDCFYRDLRMLPILFLPGLSFWILEEKQLIAKKREELRKQFKELLLYTVAAQKAGYAVENAFLNGYAGMAGLYGKESGICKMILELKEGLVNGKRIQDLWKAIGEETDIEEIKEFSAVFSIAKESGGNMTVVMERTAQNIESRVDTKIEMDTFLSARKLEQKIMNVMPLLLILYLNVTSPGYFDGLYHNMLGVVLMTICLFTYILAYLIGRRMIEIEV